MRQYARADVRDLFSFAHSWPKRDLSTEARTTGARLKNTHDFGCGKGFRGGRPTAPDQVSLILKDPERCLRHRGIVRLRCSRSPKSAISPTTVRRAAYSLSIDEHRGFSSFSRSGGYAHLIAFFGVEPVAPDGAHSSLNNCLRIDMKRLDRSRSALDF